MNAALRVLDLEPISDCNIDGDYGVILHNGKVIPNRSISYRGLQFNLHPWSKRADSSFPRPKLLRLTITMAGQLLVNEVCLRRVVIRQAEVRSKFTIAWETFTAQTDQRSWWQQHLNTAGLRSAPEPIEESKFMNYAPLVTGELQL